MARKRPNASPEVPPAHDFRAQAPQDRELGLTRSQAHAERRCAPLTPLQFKEIRQLAEKGISPLRRI